jgi:hypothetical protein
MSKKDIRRHHRIPYAGRVRISWEGPQGLTRFALGKCFDISEEGMRIEAPEPVPLYSNVSLQADQLNLTGSATVKYSTRVGAKFILGLEMTQALRERTLSVIREAEASGKPVLASSK